MLSRDLIEFVQSGLSTIVGSAGVDRKPQCMRGMGAISDIDGHRIRVFLPCVSAGPTIQNLCTTRRIAVSLSQLGTHRTVQLKGDVVGLALASDEDRADMDRLFGLLLERLTFVGFPRSVVDAVQRWPSWRVEFAVTDVFLQTPGPQAGLRLEGDVTWI